MLDKILKVLLCSSSGANARKRDIAEDREQWKKLVVVSMAEM